MGKTDVLENRMLDYSVRGVQPAAFTPHMGLFTAAPTDTTAGTEVSGGGYARQDVSAEYGTAAAAGSVSNDAEVAFPQATANWGTVTHFGIFDAASGGNLLRWGALGTAKAVNQDDTPKFAIGALTHTED